MLLHNAEFWNCKTFTEGANGALSISFDQSAYSIYTKVVYNYVLVAFGTQRERESASS